MGANITEDPELVSVLLLVDSSVVRLASQPTDVRITGGTGGSGKTSGSGEVCKNEREMRWSGDRRVVDWLMVAAFARQLSLNQTTPAEEK